MSELVSKCCHAKMIVAGNVTKHYKCARCYEPCDYIIDDHAELQDMFNKLLSHKIELQGKYDKALSFIREVNNGFCLNQTTDEALLHFVKIEADAHGLLEILGEDK